MRGSAPAPLAAHGRILIWCATLGAIFPDSDSILDIFDPNGMAVLTEHRGLTHSLVLLPLWTLAFALATRWLAQRRGWLSPSFGWLTTAWAAGLGCHIFLDLINSWGTMIWMPLARTRVVWDLTFVIDFTLSAIVLAPQLAAWVYRAREGALSRGLTAWMLFSLGAIAVERIARLTGFGFSPWVIVAVGALSVAVYVLPVRGAGAYRISCAAWCRAGCYLLLAYLGLCFAANRAAMSRIEDFTRERGLVIERTGAIPMPPGLTHWVGLVRTPNGVYQARFSLLDAYAPEFRLVADAAPNAYVEAARRDPGAQTYLWFARFPVTRYSAAALGTQHVVEFTDLRFFMRGARRRTAFTYRVTLDPEARILSAGWVE